MFSKESTQNLSTRLLSLIADTHMSLKVVIYRCVDEDILLFVKKIVIVKEKSSPDLSSFASVNCYKIEMKAGSSLNVHTKCVLNWGGYYY